MVLFAITTNMLMNAANTNKKNNQRDVSFTFLDRVREVELNLEDGRWQSALALALTIPDICGGIGFPDLVKRYRDGRVMLDRQKQPTRDVGSQYIRWFDEYAGEFFKIAPEDQTPYICGERCWQLRCEYLHQNKGFLNDEDESRIRFHLGVNCGTSVCQLEKSRGNQDSRDIRIDIEQFCWRMCRAARSYYETVHLEKEFSLYNTPVLDFIQRKKDSALDALIVVLCSNQMYAEGICTALKSVADQVRYFTTAEAAKQNLRTQKPALWIVTDTFLCEKEQLWRKNKATPVILLSDSEGSGCRDESDSKTIRLEMPVALKALRETVIALVK